MLRLLIVIGGLALIYGCVGEQAYEKEEEVLNLKPEHAGRAMRVRGCVVVTDTADPPVLMSQCSGDWMNRKQKTVFLRPPPTETGREKSVEQGLRLRGKTCIYFGKLHYKVKTNSYELFNPELIMCEDNKKRKLK